MIRKFFSPTISPLFHSHVGSFDKQSRIKNGDNVLLGDAKVGVGRKYTSTMENPIQSVVMQHLISLNNYHQIMIFTNI